MKPETIIKLGTVFITALLVLCGGVFVAGLCYIFGYNSSQASYRGVSVKEPETITAAADILVKGELTVGIGKPAAGWSGSAADSSVAGFWSHFRGGNHDAVSAEKIPLLKNLGTADTASLPELWGLPLGEGFAGFAVRNGCVYILDYDMQNQRDALRCLSFDTGEEIWRFSYPERIKKNHGMSRTIPAVTGKYCVALSPKCRVMCVDAQSGTEHWFIDLKQTYGTTEPEWYAGQCPIIMNFPAGQNSEQQKETAVIAPAGPEVLLAALDCETGQEVWRTPNPFGWTMTHSSIMPMTLDGKLTFVYCGKGGVAGVDAADGKILWSTTDWQIEIATCPSPLILPGNRIFCCGGYLSGSVMLQISKNGGQYESKTLFRLKDAVFGSEQQTPIFYDGHIFGIRQRDKQFVCLDLSGNVVWTSGVKARFGSGPYIVADGMFLILDDDGKLTACEAASKTYRQFFDVQVLDDHGCWAPMAITQGRLLLRDQTSMKCLNLKK